MEPTLERRRRITHRALPLGGLAAVALVTGIGFGSAVDSGPERVAAQFARAWSGKDYAAMHRLLAADVRGRVDLDDFTKAYERARRVATAVAVETGDPAGDDEVRVPVRVRTRLFGTIEGEILLPVGEDEKLGWAPHLVFPDLPLGWS